MISIFDSMYIIRIEGWVNFNFFFLGGGFRGNFRGEWKKDSLPILGLQRLASLLLACTSIYSMY